MVYGRPVFDSDLRLVGQQQFYRTLLSSKRYVVQRLPAQFIFDIDQDGVPWTINSCGALTFPAFDTKCSSLCCKLLFAASPAPLCLPFDLCLSQPGNKT